MKSINLADTLYRHQVKNYLPIITSKAPNAGNRLGFQPNDGGRAKHFPDQAKGDCAARAIAIATGNDYLAVFNAINELSKNERTGKRKKRISDASRGVYKYSYTNYLRSIGWTWTPTMTIGSGCKVHLLASELPNTRIICNVSKHLVAVVDHVIHDLSDCSRGGSRCVYGYWSAATAIKPSKMPVESF